jgi:hypothetical protein
LSNIKLFRLLSKTKPSLKEGSITVSKRARFPIEQNKMNYLLHGLPRNFLAKKFLVEMTGIEPATP